MTPRIHLATCDHCGRRIAWSRKRRQWLALYPANGPRAQLQRRLRCLASTAGLHDPSGNLAQRASQALDALLSRWEVAS